MYYSLICKIIKSDKFKNQRTAVVLNKPNAKFPTYINFHKNYTTACGLEEDKVYVLDILQEPNKRDGYDNWKICKTLDLGQMA